MSFWFAMFRMRQILYLLFQHACRIGVSYVYLAVFFFAVARSTLFYCSDGIGVCISVVQT